MSLKAGGPVWIDLQAEKFEIYAEQCEGHTFVEYSEASVLRK